VRYDSCLAKAGHFTAARRLFTIGALRTRRDHDACALTMRVERRPGGRCAPVRGGGSDRPKSDAIAVFGARLLDVDTESGRHARVRRPDACPVVYYPDETVPDGATKTNYKRDCHTNRGHDQGFFIPSGSLTQIDPNAVHRCHTRVSPWRDRRATGTQAAILVR
jgi:hypothetical protein